MLTCQIDIDLTDNFVAICMALPGRENLFKRLAYTLTAYFCDATGCFVKALPMGQNIVLDKSYTKQFGQISILEHCKWQ